MIEKRVTIKKIESETVKFEEVVQKSLNIKEMKEKQL